MRNDLDGFDKFDKHFFKIAAVIGIVWFCFVIVVVWAIVKLVLHFT